MGAVLNRRKRQYRTLGQKEDRVLFHDGHIRVLLTSEQVLVVESADLETQNVPVDVVNSVQNIGNKFVRIKFTQQPQGVDMMLDITPLLDGDLQELFTQLQVAVYDD